MVDKLQSIRDAIKRFASSTDNTMGKCCDEPAWGEPIIKFSNGVDSLYKFYKEDIGVFYRSPIDFLSYKYPNRSFQEETITVVSWILLQTEATIKDHRKESHFPSERWARSRIFGEEFNSN